MHRSSPFQGRTCPICRTKQGWILSRYELSLLHWPQLKDHNWKVLRSWLRRTHACIYAQSTSSYWHCTHESHVGAGNELKNTSYQLLFKGSLMYVHKDTMPGTTHQCTALQSQQTHLDSWLVCSTAIYTFLQILAFKNSQMNWKHSSAPTLKN